jgi:DnaJ-class molecular chaperone
MYKVTECKRCFGKGYIIMVNRSGVERFNRIKCPDCGGSGTVRKLVE